MKNEIKGVKKGKKICILYKLQWNKLVFLSSGMYGNFAAEALEAS